MELLLIAGILLALYVLLRGRDLKDRNTQIYERQLWEIRRLNKNSEQ